MTFDQATLWGRIQAFRFDQPTATYRFEARLMKENGWYASRAKRAIEEYRRFVFLAVAAGHPVSPSDAIDQVWHLHLLYTRTYWEEFCAKALGKPLHHEPSTGASGEAEKFEDWYARTLASYRHFFDEPPADLWPEGMAKLATEERYRRVDLSRHWLVPRRRLLAVAQGVAAAALLGALVLLATGCESANGKSSPTLWTFGGRSF